METESDGKSNIKIHGEYSNLFTGIGCFKGTFFLQVKDVIS